MFTEVDTVMEGDNVMKMAGFSKHHLILLLTFDLAMSKSNDQPEE